MNELEILIEARKWKQAEPLLLSELQDAPTDHWLWYTLSLAHYEQKRYDKAFACARRSVELQADCPLALWHLAGSAYMMGKEDMALAIWQIILDKDLTQIAEGDCGEGMDAAMRLVNDVHYRVGRLYQRQGKVDQARDAYQKYLHNREHGVESTYDGAEARKFLAKLEAA
jgi:tetratricopeptide (TPR) repeat protein